MPIPTRSVPGREPRKQVRVEFKFPLTLYLRSLFLQMCKAWQSRAYDSNLETSHHRCLTVNRRDTFQSLPLENHPLYASDPPPKPHPPKSAEDSILYEVHHYSYEREGDYASPGIPNQRLNAYSQT